MSGDTHTGGSVSVRGDKIVVCVRRDAEEGDVEMELELFHALLMTWGVFKAATELVGESGVQAVIQQLQIMEAAQYDSTKVH